MLTKNWVFAYLFLSWAFLLNAQSAPFSVVLTPVSIAGLDGLQSFAVGQHQGKWLLVGGRLDGLHRRQPFATFDLAGHNRVLRVVDPLNGQQWSAPLTTLPVGMQEQLASTNMQFYQEGDYLYCLGGYGYSATAGDHVTFAKLTAIKVPEVIEAIVNKRDIAPYFRQITDPLFQVTGGKLKKIEDRYYLLGGQKFMGRYNPMGPTHGPGFEQQYTEAVRVFTLKDDGSTIAVQHLQSWSDKALFHRRDYNAEAQILPDGQQGITMFSGVFQTAVDLPFLNSVTLNATQYKEDSAFQQYYNHYHCATLPLYSEKDNAMHTVFFGGIAQFYDSAGTLVRDNNVPFVKTIARVTRDSRGQMAEYKLPVEMPALLGAGSEFIPNESLPRYKNGVIRLDALPEDGTLVGYVYGGISSKAPNIFWINDGTQSTAHHQIFGVYVTRNPSVGAHDLNEQSLGTLRLQAYPNPTHTGALWAQFHLEKDVRVKISVWQLNGQKVSETVLDHMALGDHLCPIQLDAGAKGGAYLIQVETPYEKAAQKVVIKP